MHGDALSPVTMEVRKAMMSGVAFNIHMSGTNRQKQRKGALLGLTLRSKTNYKAKESENHISDLEGRSSTASCSLPIELFCLSLISNSSADHLWMVSTRGSSCYYLHSYMSETFQKGLKSIELDNVLKPRGHEMQLDIAFSYKYLEELTEVLDRYLTYCGKLFNGLRCTDECRTVIEDMLAMPKAALLNDCVCDGLERPICESVKENMARLCFGAELGNGPGSSGSDGGLDDYYDEEYDDEQRTGGTGGEQPLDDDDGVPHPPRPGGGAAAAGGRGDLPYGPGRRSSGAGCRSAPRSAWTLFASILLLPLLF
ncbi:hypothetical protein E5288_WYG022155 [Bos mutus]|uniref:Uncharacterized protein n=1 Tax=Bos mutus TaxID=72004 RepID=A0A6B0RKU1_9CETA|nr:hypothetical protein [Bos mutus]